MEEVGVDWSNSEGAFGEVGVGVDMVVVFCY